MQVSVQADVRERGGWRLALGFESVLHWFLNLRRGCKRFMAPVRGSRTELITLDGLSDAGRKRESDWNVLSRVFLCSNTSNRFVSPFLTCSKVV